MHTIDVNQAQQHLPELIEETINGDEVVITKSGQPVVKLVPITKTNNQRLCGTAKGLIKMSDGFEEPLEDFKEYM